MRAAVVSDDRELRIEIEIVAGQGEPGPAQRRGADPAPGNPGALRVVLFAPEDLAIVRGDPSERRRFLDELLVQRSPRLAGLISDYERVLKQRAALLKSAAIPGRRRARAPERCGSGCARARADLSTLDIWDGHLAARGAELLAARFDAVAELQPHVSAAYAQVAPSSAPLKLSYQSSLGESMPRARGAGAARRPACSKRRLLAELARVRPQELERGVNLVGPASRRARTVASAIWPCGVTPATVSLGRRRSRCGWAAMSCCASDHSAGGSPVLILDDVFAELDGERREHLAQVADKAEQALITAAVAGDVPGALLGSRYDVYGGAVHRVR